MNALLATLAFLFLGAFLAILIIKVPHPDLIIVTLVALAMCGYDFIRSVKSNEQH